MYITDEIKSQIEHFVTSNNPESKGFYNKLCKLLFKNSVLQETNYKCVYCSNFATTLDHIIPKKCGGQSLQSNLVGACNTCNTSKGTIYWKTWYKQQSFYNKEIELYICNRLTKYKK
jgi:methionyl-tRNA synthetase